MDTIFGVPTSALFGQVFLGLINGSFYALMSLGLAIIFGLLHVVNFAHGVQYMLGALTAWFLLDTWGVSYWWSLLLAPIIVGLSGLFIERFFNRYATDITVESTVPPTSTLPPELSVDPENIAPVVSPALANEGVWVPIAEITAIGAKNQNITASGV